MSDRSPLGILRRVGEQSALYCYDVDGEKISSQDVVDAVEDVKLQIEILKQRLEEQTERLCICYENS